MAADLERLAQYHREQGNTPRTNLYLGLAAEERSLGTPETLVPNNSPDQLEIARPNLALADLKTRTHFRDYAAYELTTFLGREVVPAAPSQEFVDAGKRIQDCGDKTFEPIAFPDLTLEKGTVYPQAWKHHVDQWIYSQIAEGRVSPDAITLKKGWGWLDTSVRPKYDGGRQMFTEGLTGSLGLVVAELRSLEQIYVPERRSGVDARSRFWISAQEAENVVFPTLAEKFNVDKDQVTALGAGEFNFAGNLRYDHFGTANTWEWFQNRFGGGDRLIGGHSGDGGLSSVYCSWAVNHLGRIAVRPLVRFLSKA